MRRSAFRLLACQYQQAVLSQRASRKGDGIPVADLQCFVEIGGGLYNMNLRAIDFERGRDLVQFIHEGCQHRGGTRGTTGRGGARGYGISAAVWYPAVLQALAG